jgi:hypothetical protein
MTMRTMTPADFAAVLVLDQASVHFQSPLALHGQQAQHRESPLCLCVEQDGLVVAYVITNSCSRSSPD